MCFGPFFVGLNFLRNSLAIKRIFIARSSLSTPCRNFESRSPVSFFTNSKKKKKKNLFQLRTVEPRSSGESFDLLSRSFAMPSVFVSGVLERADRERESHLSLSQISTCECFERRPTRARRRRASDRDEGASPRYR